jgi:hypothetical protein
MKMRTKLSLLAMLMALAAPAQAAEKQSWDYIKSGETIQFSYGVPDSHEVTIIFRCAAGGKSVDIVSTITPRKPKKGQAAKTTLSNGSTTVVYDGKFGRDSEDSGFHFFARVPATPNMFAVLKSGKTLTISLPGGQDRVPLRGVAKSMAEFEAACFGAKGKSAKAGG